MKRPLLWLALLSHFVFATAYLLRTPAFEGPDENAHCYYASYLEHTGSLPVIVNSCSPLLDGAAAHHPPLYYAVLIGLMKVLGTGDYTPCWSGNPEWATASPRGHLHFVHGHDEAAPVSDEIVMLRILRGFSVLCGAATILLTHRLGLALFPRTPRIAEVAALALACLPQWSWMHGCLDNGNLAATLSVATLLVLVRGLQARRLGAGRGLAAGTIAGLALITKLTALFLLPLLLCTYAYGLLAWRQQRRATAASGSAALLALLAVSGWSFWRNIEIYGDPFMLEAIAGPLAQNMVPEGQRWSYLTGDFLTRTFGSAIAGFGWNLTRLPAAIEWCSLGLIVAALAGAAAHRRELWRQGGAALALTVLAVLIVIAGVAKLNASYVQPQGRYLFPAFGPFLVLVSAGLVLTARGALQRFGRASTALALLPVGAAACTFAFVFLPEFPRQVTATSPFYASMVEGL